MAELTKAESDLFKKAQTLTDKVKKNPEISADHKLETLQTIQSTTQKLIKKMYVFTLQEYMKKPSLILMRVFLHLAIYKAFKGAI